MKKLYINSFKIKFRKNDKVFEEGDDPIAIYIIRKGEFSVVKKIERNNMGITTEHQTDNQFPMMKSNLQPHYQKPLYSKIAHYDDKDN